MEHTRTFGWCFIGSGSITRRVMRDLSRYSKTSYLATVYSPNPSHAKSLADLYGAKACSTPEEAMMDSSVNGVYVATPHIHHQEYAQMALRLGRPVLCEKPMTPNARQTGELIQTAKETGVYLAEAMWTRYNPVVRRVKEWVDAGRIGKLYCVEADFGYAAGYDPANGLFQPEKAGGGILDVGIYPIALAQLLYGDVMPEKIAAFGEKTPSGVDANCGMLLGYPSGGVATLFTAVRSQTPSLAKISGEEGVILLDAPFWRSKGATLQRAGEQERFCIDQGDYEGYHFEFDGVVSEILAGERESRVMALDHTRTVAAIMDEARRQLGVSYPFD